MATRHRYGVIGYPLKHSLSRYLHRWFFKVLDINGAYDTYPIKPDVLELSLSDLTRSGLQGFNVTIPYKEAIIPMLDDLSPVCRRIGAVNTVQTRDGKLIGHNTDALGFTHMLSQHGITVAEQTVLVLGAGGAARSVVFALGAMGARATDILNRSLSRAAALCEIMGAISPDMTLSALESVEGVSLRKYDIIINATPVGMWPDMGRSPLEIRTLRSETVAVDLVYNPLQTEFLKQAESAGATTIDGLDMLIHQGEASLQIWLGLDAPLAYNHADLRGYLAGKLPSLPGSSCQCEAG